MWNKPMWRRIRWKWVAWIVGGGLAIYLTVGIILVGNDTPPIPPSSQMIDLRGGQVHGNRIATKSWSFDYQHAELSPDGTTGTVDGVRNGVVFRKGKPYLKVSAEHVSVNTQSLDFTAIGKVHVERLTDPERRSFDTDLVVWTNDAKLLHMDHPSYFHTEGQTMELDGVTIDFSTDSVHIAKLVGNVNIKK
jgi:hypothetical protein